ncbi:MAG: hypothetical protein H7A05_03490 [Pseudomonadales bacterium]|nr:hypothetical protein [Pseudomonadales bacterium]MCP5329803.1 hypothetical protein [Pseudomonadales bacterium]MCP5343660.1 hypothetical protein [Pseudomonadales bacterium]
MKTGIIAAILILACAAVAFMQFSAAMQLKQELAHSEEVRIRLEGELAAQKALVTAQQSANAELQARFQEQLNTLQSSLQSSSGQLQQLSESLQEARGLLQGEPQ